MSKGVIEIETDHLDSMTGSEMDARLMEIEECALMRK